MALYGTAWLLANAKFTGTPTAPTASPGTNNTQVATTAYTDSAVLVETTRAETQENLSPFSSATLAALGIKAWNFPSFLAGAAGTALAAAGVVYLAKIPLTGAPVTITNVLYTVNTVGSGLTAAENFVGVYSDAGVLIGTSADQSTNFVGTGLKTAALTGGPFTGSWPFVYVAALFNGTTGPALLRGYNGAGAPQNVSLNATGSGLLAATNSTGKTTLPTPLVYGSNSGTVSTPQCFWCALS